MNGDKVGQGSVDAREMTREIERETSLAVEAQNMQELKGVNRGDLAQRQGVEDAHSGGISNEQAVNLGNKVLTYNPSKVAQVETEMGRNAEIVREMVEAENGLAGEAMQGEVADGESELLVAEREAWNRENLLNETDPRRDNEAKIMAHDQKGIAEDIANRVSAVTQKNDFRIMDLVLLQSKGRDATLEAYENPRRLGDMN